TIGPPEAFGIRRPPDNSLERGAPDILNVTLRKLAEGIALKFKRTPTILYPSSDVYQGEFPIGSQEVLMAAITNIALVDEKNLQWRQVLEFRKDSEARNKYRRFIRWINLELRSSSPDEVKDLIATRLEDYEWALKKHGIKNTLGTLSCILDP